ncbi:DUF4123 domain-containing protein [Vibrio palustris]|uniref:DUF4123 domain-containing protein n=1 Tax=Vibrio palustris TaxID=1918946 RepID=A0A1R4B2D6_9VIBR|nr:DUF4123 domain-containing protein [Vibrio palustris]SJL83075.1 hypothetical protein VPAL9027_01023 [Vibrio palustris]
MLNEISRIESLLPTESKRWIVIDRALVPDAEKLLLQYAMHNDFTIEVQNLFFKTQWEAVSDVGPLLVSYHDKALQWLIDQAGWRFGLVFDANASINELYHYWVTRIHCQHLGFENELLRFYDPVVVYHLLKDNDYERNGVWTESISDLWLPNMVDKTYWHIANDGYPADNTEIILSFNDAEWQGLTDAATYCIAYNLTDHLKTYFPDNSRGSTEADFHYCQHLLQELQQYGDISEKTGALYINIVSRLGDQWSENPQHEKMSQLLSDGSRSLLERLRDINEYAFAYCNQNISQELSS